MPEYLSPGVYVEEIDAGPKPIEGVSTSTAGAAGVTRTGPTTGKPELITSFADFVRKFGGFMPDPPDALYNRWANNPVDGGRFWQFPLAVKGFFDNGGQRLYVKRVISGAAVAANTDFGKGLVSEITADVAADATTVRLRHLIGIDKGREVEIFAGDPPVSVNKFKVINYDSAALSVTLDGPVGKAVKAGKGYVQIKPIVTPADKPAEKTLAIRAKDRGGSGNDIYVRVRPMIGPTLNVLHDPATAGPPTTTLVFKDPSKMTTVTWLIEVDDVTGLGDGDTITIKKQPYTVKNTNATLKTFEVDVAPPDSFLSPDEATGLKVTFKKKNNTDAKISFAGTRRNIGIENAAGLAKDSKIQFVPTGKDYTLTDNPENNVFPISPAIPVGRDWESKKIRLKEVKVTEVKADAAAGDTVVLNDVSTLKVGDEIFFKNDKFKVSNITPGVSPEGTVKVVPAFAAGAEPKKDDAVTKKDVVVPVTRTAATWTVAVAATAGFAQGDHIILNGEEYVVSAVDPGKSLTILSHKDSGDPWPPGTTVRLLRAAQGADKTKINVANAGLLYKHAIVELDNGEKKETRTVISVNGDTVELNSPLTGKYLEGNKVRVIEAEVGARQLVEGQLLKEEDFVNLQLRDNKDLSFLVTQVKTLSSLIEIASLGPGFPNDDSKLADLANFPIAPNGDWARLENGQDNIDQLSVDDFVGEDKGKGNRTGIQAFEDIDEISICLVPCLWSPVVHAGLIQHCEALKDRFAVLDPPSFEDGLSVEEIREFREPYDTKYAALYYPWIEVRDPLAKRNVQVAPSGHMAGVYARTDVNRGVHKAPANEVIQGITKIYQDITKREQDMLNPRNINVLRFFPGRGNRVWGARVVTSDSSWKYINVRRLFIYVEESIDEGTQFVVFEPNDEPLWARVRATITNFLTTVWRSGALQGTKPDEAFFVKCDRTTMTQDDIDNGRLICVIGIAPVKPAEFVIFRIQQKTLETKVS